MKRKLLCLLLALLLIPVLCAGAEETDAYVRWELSEDGQVLSLDGQEYVWYPMAYGDLLKPQEVLVYENPVPAPNGDGELYVSVNPENPHMVFLVSYRSSMKIERVYVTEEGRRILDGFVKGEFSSGMLGKYTYEGAPLSVEVVEKLDAGSGETITMDVVELRDLNCYTVYVYDETQSIAHAHGGIYVMSNGYCYINYDLLDNTHFDSNGEFSYRSGCVTLTKVEQSLARETSYAVGKQENWDTVRTYESDADVLPEVEESSALTVFYIMSVLGGVVIPGVPLVLGLIFARSKKSVNPNKWYLLSVLGAAWSILACMIVILIITSA